jgi:hypothetical protein
MNSRTINVEEQAALRLLELNGPSRTLSSRVQGRLALYGMIAEGPGGWAITASGRRVLHTREATPMSPEDLLFAMGPVLATAANW